MMHFSPKNSKLHVSAISEGVNKCDSRHKVTPYSPHKATPTTAAKPNFQNPQEPTSRAKINQNFDKLKHLFNPIQKPPLFKSHQKSTLNLSGKTPDPNEESKGRIYKLKEQMIEHPVEISAISSKYAKKDIKVPKFLCKSQELQGGKSPGAKSIIVAPSPSPPPMSPLKLEPKLNKEVEPKPSKEVESVGEQAQRTQKWIMMKIHGKIEFFQTIKFLDEGSFGRVFLVRHTLTNMIFCIKMIDKAEITDESLHQIVREITIQSYIRHPNIVSLYSFSSDKDFIYLLLEPCLEGNLYTRLKEEPLQERVARHYVKEICSTLEYLHKKDIIHRDIKPENILLHENTVKLCDFGWAVHSPLLRNTKCGTPIYTCPEIVKKEPYDSKIDIWCVGVLTYEILFGSAPFAIRTTRDLFKILSYNVTFPKKLVISETAKDFICSCLAK